MTGYNVIFNITNKKIVLQNQSLIVMVFFQITIPQGAYELESLNDENGRNIIDGRHFTEANSPFITKPNFSILWSVIEISRQKPLISSLSDDSIRNL